MSRIPKFVYFNDIEEDVLERIADEFEKFEGVDRLGIVGCSMIFYRYNPKLPGGKMSTTVRWTGTGWEVGGGAPKKHSRVVKINNKRKP